MVCITSKPVAGEGIAALCAPVILGISMPFVVLDTSNCADEFGVLVPIPMFCALANTHDVITNKLMIILFIITELFDN